MAGRPHFWDSPKQPQSTCGLNALLQVWLPGSADALTPWSSSWHHPQACLLVSGPTSSVYLPVILPVQLCKLPRSRQHLLCPVKAPPTPVSASWGPPAPAPSTKDPGPSCNHHRVQGSWGRSATYLSHKELELVRQNPWAGVEVVLLRKEILHDSYCSAQSNFTHHLRHAWGEEKLWGFNNSGPLAIKQP